MSREDRQTLGNETRAWRVLTDGDVTLLAGVAHHDFLPVPPDASCTQPSTGNVYNLLNNKCSLCLETFLPRSSWHVYEQFYDQDHTPVFLPPDS